MSERDNLLGVVYKHVYASPKWGGASGGAMFSQMMAEGMSSYEDGYDIVLSENLSTSTLVSGQSHKLVIYLP